MDLSVIEGLNNDKQKINTITYVFPFFFLSYSFLLVCDALLWPFSSFTLNEK